MSQRSQRDHELMHGKSNPMGVKESDIEVDENHALFCDDCDSEQGGTETEDLRTTCVLCGSQYCSSCASKHGRPCYEDEETK